MLAPRHEIIKLVRQWRPGIKNCDIKDPIAGLAWFTFEIAGMRRCVTFYYESGRTATQIATSIAAEIPT